MVAAIALLLKIGRTTISPIIINVSQVGDLMVYFPRRELSARQMPLTLRPKSS
jgi:hypothetical protein